MRDVDVRAALYRGELARYASDPDTRIVPELGIHRGDFRIDIAVVNGTLHGYELKSARDTLQRLPAQAAAYSTVFDFVTLVAAERHLWKAAAIVPEWWGLSAVVPGSKGETVREERPCLENPRIDPYLLAQLLWAAEATELLERYGGARGFRGRPTVYLWSEIARRLSLDELRTEVRTVLKTRGDWRARSPS